MQTEIIIEQYTTRCLIHVFLLDQLKSYKGGKNLSQRLLRGLATWKDMLEKCVERYRELANKKVEQLYKVSSLLLG